MTLTDRPGKERFLLHIQRHLVARKLPVARIECVALEWTRLGRGDFDDVGQDAAVGLWHVCVASWVIVFWWVGIWHRLVLLAERKYQCGLDLSLEYGEKRQNVCGWALKCEERWRRAETICNGGRKSIVFLHVFCRFP